MANCSRCGKSLEKDGFCMNCMDFAIEDEEQQKASDNRVVETKPYADDYKQIYKAPLTQQNKTYAAHSNIQEIDEKPSKSIIIRRFLAYVVMAVGFGIIGFFVIANMMKSNKVKKSSDVLIFDGVNSTSNTDKDNSGEEEAKPFNTFDTIEEENDTVYEADYDEIMKAGEPSNMFYLFQVQKNEVAPVMEEYFKEQGVNTTFSSDMNNTYRIVDGEKYTDYSSYSMWTYGKEQNNQYIIFYDTVTGQLLHVDICVEKEEEAIELVKKSLSAINPSLESQEIKKVEEELHGNMNPDVYCRDYEISGKYSETSGYNFIITSTVDNRK